MSDDTYLSPVSDTFPKKPSGFGWWILFAVIGIVVLLVSLSVLARDNKVAIARRTQCRNNLKQIGLALHNYHDVYNSFPPAYTVDSDGRPLHSWRTLILPYMDQQALYASIDLTKPWDDAANAEALATTPHVFRCPASDLPEVHTTYCGIVGEDTAFHLTQCRKIRDFEDGTSNTLLVFEVSPEEAVPWMAPHDTGERFLLSFGADTEFAHEMGTHALVTDGSTRFIGADISHANRQALMTIAADDTPTGDW